MAYTTIDDPSAYFQTALFTGNAGTNAITNTGNSDLQPDWVWFKCRSATEHHGLFDSVRGVTKAVYSNLDIAEDNLADSLASFNSDGFTMGADTGSSGAFNGNSKTMVAWQWKAGTSFTNDASSTGIGSIDSAGSVSTAAGFSIISYTGTGSNGTVAHGLGVVPSMIIIKNREISQNWLVYHQALENTSALKLNSTKEKETTVYYWNNTSPTSSTFSLGASSEANTDAEGNIAYCFAEKQGYSKFGSYTGNGNADGTFIYTGFKPAFILRKRTDSTGSWLMQDNKRPGSNRAVANSLPTDNNVLYSNTTDAELFNNELDILSNGFKLRATDTFGNGSGATYIFMCFAENPFTTSTGIPATAR